MDTIVKKLSQLKAQRDELSYLMIECTEEELTRYEYDLSVIEAQIEELEYQLDETNQYEETFYEELE